MLAAHCGGVANEGARVGLERPAGAALPKVEVRARELDDRRVEVDSIRRDSSVAEEGRHGAAAEA